MKKKEKIVILILIIITIVLVIIGTIQKNNKKENEVATPEASSESNSETEATNNDEIEENVTELDDGTKLNVSSALNKTKTNLEGLEISNIQLTEKGGASLLLGTVTNVSDQKQGGYYVNIKFKAENGDELITITGAIAELEPGESTQLNAGGTFDVANAYDFEITKV